MTLLMKAAYFLTLTFSSLGDREIIIKKIFFFGEEIKKNQKEKKKK